VLEAAKRHAYNSRPDLAWSCFTYKVL